MDALHGLVDIDETCLAITDRLVPVSANGRRSKTAKVVVAIAVEIVTPRSLGAFGCAASRTIAQRA